MSENELSGTIPSTLGNLTHLQDLNLGGNQLSGAIPASFSRLLNLRELKLFQNQLSGAMPASLARLSNLQWLDLAGNQLSGSFPFQWTNLTRLQFLDLSDNRLEIGQPPVGLFSLPLDVLSLRSCGISSLPCTHPLPNSNISSLDLSSNNLSADALHCLARAPLQLTYLNLSRNPFHSALPSHLTCLATYSAHLHLRSCNLTGRLSSTFLASPALTTLSSLDLSRNQLVGTLPSMVGNLSSLESLDLSHNGFTGPLPNSLGRLFYLRLGHNRLQGEIPSDLGNLCNLEVLALHDNNFIGTFPNLCNCSFLQLLDLSRNNLQGTLDDLGLFQSVNSLRVLALGSNRMNGSIPESLGSFSPALQVIDLSQNNFSGTIPPNLNLTAFRILGGASYSDFQGQTSTLYEEVILNTKGNPLDYTYILRTMISLHLGGNSLNGGIPSSLGNLSHMVFLNLSHNYLTGPIPDSLSNLSALESLDLSNNSLQGPIPPRFSTLTSLAEFNVSYNQLSGPIPQGSQFNTFTNASYMGNDGLCGGIPLLRQCPGLQPPAAPLPPPTKSTSFISLIDDWVSIPAVCIGYVVTFIITVWFLNFSPFRM